MDVSASAGSPCPQFSVKRMEPPSAVVCRSGTSGAAGGGGLAPLAVMLASLSMLKQAIFFLQLSQSITRTPRLLKLDDDPAPAGEALCIGSSTQLLMDDYMYLVQSSSGLAQSMHSPELARVAVTADAPREQNRTVEDCKLYGIRFSEQSLSSRKLDGAGRDQIKPMKVDDDVETVARVPAAAAPLGRNKPHIFTFIVDDL
jgi:hypothetical protein